MNTSVHDRAGEWEMSNVSVPDVKVRVIIAGTPIATFEFHRVDKSPQDWEVTAALEHPDARSAVRACLLAAIAQLADTGWETYTFEAESGGEADDQLELPF